MIGWWFHLKDRDVACFPAKGTVNRDRKWMRFSIFHHYSCFSCWSSSLLFFAFLVYKKQHFEFSLELLVINSFYIAMFHFYSPENFKKPRFYRLRTKVFWRFQCVYKWNIGAKWTKLNVSGILNQLGIRGCNQWVPSYVYEKSNFLLFSWLAFRYLGTVY